jgi:hypothetical protein
MAHLVLLVLAVLAPVVILTILRVDAALVFLSLCLGYVLVQFVSYDAVSLVTSIFPHASSLSDNTVKLIFLLLPAVLTIIFMFHSVSGTRVILNFLPALGVGLLGVLLLEPLLSSGTRVALESSSLWHNFQQAQTLIVGASSIVSLLFLWMHRKQGHHGKSSRHHSKS